MEESKMKDFHYHMPVDIYYGNDAAKKRLGSLVKGENVLIICDPFLYQCGTAQEIAEAMKGKNVCFFSDIEPNPSCETVDRAAAVARENRVDSIVGIGGGSSLDVSKIVSCLACQEGSIYDYYAGGTKQLKNRDAQLICIPTTAGTGSEVTNVGVYTDRKTGTKMPMVNDLFWADIALVDPQLTYTLPPAVTASTGMDAFCHAIEAFWNVNSLPICDWLAIGAMRKILDNIEIACRDGKNADARGEMLVASLIAGIAFSQTRTTGIHALSFPLTAEFGASHGTACAITLPAFIRMCAKEKKVAWLSQELGFESVQAFAQEIEKKMEKMGMATRLSRLGIEEKDIAHIAEVGLNAAIIHLTPVEMNQETVCRCLHTIL